MRLKLLGVITVLLLVIAALSVTGCTVNLPGSSSPTPSPTSTPTSTPTPTLKTDYSSFFSSRYEGVTSIVVQPFAKASGLNMRANDVYRGVIRNASQPGSKSETIVIELTKSKDQAKQLFDNEVATKTSTGYVYNSVYSDTWKAFEKGANVQIGEAWYGSNSAGNSFLCITENNAHVGSWLFITQASG